MLHLIYSAFEIQELGVLPTFIDWHLLDDRDPSILVRVGGYQLLSLR